MVGCQQAGLSDTRTFTEVQELEQALKILIYRAGGIHKAKSARTQNATAMVFKQDVDIPIEVMVNPTGSIEAGAQQYFAQHESQELRQQSPRARGLAVWADAAIITPEIRKQLPSCTHRVRCCSDITQPAYQYVMHTQRCLQPCHTSHATCGQATLVVYHA